MLTQQPFAQLGNGRLRPSRNLGRDRLMKMHQKTHNRRLLRSRRRSAGAGQPLPRFDDIRHADTEPRGDLPRASFRGQHSVAQILRVGLSAPPTHGELWRLPETYESQFGAAPESLFEIPPSPEPL